MTKGQVEVGQVYAKIGERLPRQWRVVRVFDLPEGQHARLVRLDDPSRTITLAADAVLDRRLMTLIADGAAP